MILSLDEFQRKADEVRGNSSIFGSLFQAYLSKVSIHVGQFGD